MIDAMSENFERMGFVLASESLKTLVAGGSMAGRRLTCR